VVDYTSQVRKSNGGINDRSVGNCPPKSSPCRFTCTTDVSSFKSYNGLLSSV